MKPVLITTEFRGVFFGYLEDEKKLPDQVVLKKARNCIYWSNDVEGFVGLAAKGPTKGCKIGAQISEITLYKITSVASVTESAAKAWTDA